MENPSQSPDVDGDCSDECGSDAALARNLAPTGRQHPSPLELNRDDTDVRRGRHASRARETVFTARREGRGNGLAYTAWDANYVKRKLNTVAKPIAGGKSRTPFSNAFHTTPSSGPTPGSALTRFTALFPPFLPEWRKQILAEGECSLSGSEDDARCETRQQAGWVGTRATPLDQDFYPIMNVAIGAKNGWFPDGQENKPWLIEATCGTCARGMRRGDGSTSDVVDVAFGADFRRIAPVLLICPRRSAHFPPLPRFPRLPLSSLIRPTSSTSPLPQYLHAPISPSPHLPAPSSLRPPLVLLPFLAPLFARFALANLHPLLVLLRGLSLEFVVSCSASLPLSRRASTCPAEREWGDSGRSRHLVLPFW
ncbi:hypothetical protein C8R45DRAFT_934248 [Mycena sanguinolenta]|nr:hypothetical protein C8R45DRAFT_934248 [Mycena sanguinolenta]